jgi:hypothetical protein
MANTLDVTKLHVLIPTEYRSSLEIRIESDNDDPTARFTRLLGLNDDDVISKQVKLSNIAKHFPTKETFVAAPACLERNQNPLWPYHTQSFWT